MQKKNQILKIWERPLFDIREYTLSYSEVIESNSSLMVYLLSIYPFHLDFLHGSWYKLLPS